MIVNTLAKGWEVFFHRGHAVLAAQIGAQLAWTISDRPVRLIETIAAILHHDDLAVEWEGHHLSEVGTPLDFTLQAAESKITLEPMEQLVDHARYRGRWVAMLVSMHCCFLNAPKRQQSKTLATFLRNQKAQQKRWQHELGITVAQANQAYAFMQWCDRLSLILCQRELPQRQRAIEISLGPDGKRYDAVQQEDGSVTVQPWPFKQASFSVDAEASYLDQPTFKDNDALIAALRSAPIKTIEWQFVEAGAAQKGKNAPDRQRHSADKKRSQSHGEE